MGWRDRAKPVSDWRSRARQVAAADAADLPAEAGTSLPSEMGGQSSDYTADASPQTRAAATGMLAAAARGASQGATLGWGDELAAGAGAAVGNSDKPTIGGRYTELRDSMRNDNDAAHAEHPWAFRTGEVLGGLPLAIATTGKGAGLRRLVLTSGALAGTAAAGDSKADTAGGVLADSALPAAIGAALPFVLDKASAAVPRLARALEAAGIKYGRRVLQGGASLLGNATRPVSEDAVREAAAVGAFRPLGTTEGAAERVDAVRDAVGDAYRGILKSLEERGIRGPEAEKVAQRMAAEGRNVAATNTNPAVRSVYDSEAAALRAQEPTGDFTVPRDEAGRLGLSQAEDLKRALQDRARYNRVNVAETPQNEARKAAASMVRQSVEDAVEQQTAAADPETQAIGQQFVPVKQRLGRLIEAGDALEKAVSQKAKRSNSLHGTIARAAGLGRLAAGDPSGAIQALGSEALDGLIRNRASSTAAWGANKGADLLHYLIDNPRTAPQASTQALINALRRGAGPVVSEDMPHAMGE